MIISPCISICKTDPTTGYCYGCGRSNEEKRLWKLEETTDDWKKENIIEIEKRPFFNFNNIFFFPIISCFFKFPKSFFLITSSTTITIACCWISFTNTYTR